MAWFTFSGAKISKSVILHRHPMSFWTSQTASAQQPRVANGYYTGLCHYKHQRFISVLCIGDFSLTPIYPTPPPEQLSTEWTWRPAPERNIWVSITTYSSRTAGTVILECEFWYFLSQWFWATQKIGCYCHLQRRTNCMSWAWTQRDHKWPHVSQDIYL